jgi:Signal transduction histidine kinase
MRKYYFISIIATLAIICIQAFYIARLHENYITDKITEIRLFTKKALFEELNVRTRNQIKRERRVYYNHIDDMTQEERDSMLRISSKDDTLINLTNTKDNLLGETLDDIFRQLEQDEAMNNGINLDITVLDSIFRSLTSDHYTHLFTIYDTNKLKISSIGNLKAEKPTYISPLYAIGTKSKLYIQIDAFIPMSGFIEFQFQVLTMSAFMILIIVSCLLYQLIVIRRKSMLLQKRETSVNGTIHDLKAPLNSIVTMLSWFKMKNNDIKTGEIIETCQVSVKHMVHNIESLLLSARSDRKKIVLNKINVDIIALIQLVKRELDVLFQNKKHIIEIVNKLPENYIIYADSMYLENVIRNLLENSLKYSDDGVRVVVELFSSNNTLNVVISDNGWGIPSKERKKIFKQFYQVSRSKDKMQKGDGIGLTHVLNIIKAHEGDITLRSIEKQGSTFSFYIPLS